jgi:hypothetical protein
MRLNPWNLQGDLKAFEGLTGGRDVATFLTIWSPRGKG